jgi:hypothetical protein
MFGLVLFCIVNLKGVQMKTIEVELTGDSALLQHRMSEEALFGLLGAKTKKKQDKEELTPREIAEKGAYKSEDGSFYIPSTYISGAFKAVASDYRQTNSKRSLKAIAAGVFRPLDMNITLLDDSNEPIKNFEVDIMKGTNHLKGAVAICRPRFDKWKVKTTVEIDEELLSQEICHQVLNDAGRRAGIGAFRVSKGGPFGRFRVTKFKVI